MSDGGERQGLVLQSQPVDQGSNQPRETLEGNEGVAQRFPETSEEEGQVKDWNSYAQRRWRPLQFKVFLEAGEVEDLLIPFPVSFP